jgi:hypothetical protein
MDEHTTLSAYKPNIIGRTKSQILMEEFGGCDYSSMSDATIEIMCTPVPPLETWTTLKLPYQAPSCPIPLPSLQQLKEASRSAQTNLRYNNGSTAICRIGSTVIKYCAGPKVVEVSRSRQFHVPLL